MSKNDKTISEKLTSLGELVAWFESDEFALEDALKKFGEAEELAKEIETDLTEFKNKIEIVKKDFSA